MFKKLDDFLGGWIIGKFEPTLFEVENFELGIKKVKAGEKGDGHFHKETLEHTILIDCEAKNNGELIKPNGIITIQPNEKNHTEFLTSGTIICIKIGQCKNDKYY